MPTVAVRGADGSFQTVTGRPIAIDAAPNLAFQIHRPLPGDKGKDWIVSELSTGGIIARARSQSGAITLAAHRLEAAGPDKIAQALARLARRYSGEREPRPAPKPEPNYVRFRAGARILAERILEAADSNTGFCVACGTESDGIEPDARRYKCDACGTFAVYGAEELILRMGA